MVRAREAAAGAEAVGAALRATARHRTGYVRYFCDRALAATEEASDVYARGRSEQFAPGRALLFSTGPGAIFQP